jgi:cytochrome c peroxidase
VPWVAHVALFAATVAALLVPRSAPQRTAEPTFAWDIPAPFPRPWVPDDNPMTVAKVELGRRLFYDPRLSVNGRQSCASCHQQARAFTDGRARAIGTTGQLHPRGSMSLANVGYNPALTWANPAVDSLESQALVPMFGTEPIELGLAGHEDVLFRNLRADPWYAAHWPTAFPDDTVAFTRSQLVRAIAAFERTLISVRSPYDRYRFGRDTSAISAAAKRGEQFFFSGTKGGCFQCHGGWNFNGELRHAGRDSVAVPFFNTGLYNLPGERSYPDRNTGLHAVTRRTDDVGKFRVPTLRNISVTAPYMHDGSIATLGEVLDHYAAGGRTISQGPFAGVGRDNPNKARAVRGFSMTEQDKRDLLAFLETLTDSTFLRTPALGNPWK